VDRQLPAGFFARPVPPETLDLVRSIMLEVRSAGTRPMLAAFAEADPRAVLPTVTVPTLLLYGASDLRAPRPGRRIAARRHPELRSGCCLPSIVLALPCKL
jgi:pimeloyl-ACP methyl ester carboxylesterase